jgi:hypothetical protein
VVLIVHAPLPSKSPFVRTLTAVGVLAADEVVEVEEVVDVFVDCALG